MTNCFTYRTTCGNSNTDQSMAEARSKLTVRQAVREDIPNIAQLADQERFNDGIEAFELAFEQSHEGWFVVFDEKGQLICFQLINHVLPRVDFGYLIVTKEEYKGQGVTSLLPNALKHTNLKKLCFGGYAAHDSLQKLIKGFPTEFKWGLAEYGRDVTPAFLRSITPINTPNIKIVPYADHLLPRMLQMDSRIAAMDRSKFMRGFWRAKSGFTRVAVAGNGEVRGSVTLWRCSPSELFGQAMYADNEEIAASLITKVLHDAAELSFTTFSMNVVSDKFSVQRIFRNLGFERYMGYILWRNIPSPDYYNTIDVSRLYCPHLYWPA